MYIILRFTTFFSALLSLLILVSPSSYGAQLYNALSLSGQSESYSICTGKYNKITANSSNKTANLIPPYKMADLNFYETNINNYNHLHEEPPKAYIITIDGMSFANTLLPFNLDDNENYLKDAITTELINYNNKFKITSLDWGRNAIHDSNNAIFILYSKLSNYFLKSKMNEAKIIIVAHSWGTFITHNALQLRETENNKRSIVADLVVYLGSPLGANVDKMLTRDITGFGKYAVLGFVFGAYLNYFDYLHSQDYLTTNQNNRHVKRLVNFWTRSDAFSFPQCYPDRFPFYDLSFTQCDDIQTDIKQFGQYERNFYSTSKWHEYNSLQNSSYPHALRKKVGDFILNEVGIYR